MSAQDPRFPGKGAITLRIARDDNKTFAGVSVAPENYTLASAQAKLAAAPGLSGTEIAKANAAFPATDALHVTHIQREPSYQGPGWCIFNSAANRVAYIARDDNTHLSYQAIQPLFTISAAQAALNATAGLSGAETARIAALSF